MSSRIAVSYLGLLWAGVGMMLLASASYLELGRAHPFVLEKLPLAHPRLWLVALYVHVPSALLSLPACLLLRVDRLRRRFPRVHRWLGRYTCVLVVLAVVPSGLYLAFFARGGAITTLGFWTTGLIALFAMIQSVRSARARDIREHRRFSGHVAAQLAVAVLSRLLLLGAEEVGLYGDWVYVAALWLPVLGCAAAVELVTSGRSRSSKKGSRHEELVVVHPVPVGR